MEEKLNKRQQQAAQTEERIRKAGIRLFQEKGYENTKISIYAKKQGYLPEIFITTSPVKTTCF